MRRLLLNLQYADALRDFKTREQSMSNKTQIVLCPNLEADCQPGTDLGLGDLVVIETPISAGDFLLQGDTYVTIECDKASIELPSPLSGRVVQIFVKIGDKITPKSPIMEIEVLKTLLVIGSLKLGSTFPFISM